MVEKQISEAVVEVLKSKVMAFSVNELLEELPFEATRSEVLSLLKGELSESGIVKKFDSFRWVYSKHPPELIAVHFPPPTGPLTASEVDSIRMAVREEIESLREMTKSNWLEIDAIENLTDIRGRFIYRLVLSNYVNFIPDQLITFKTRRPVEEISATVLRCDDEGLVVECAKPLPSDARLVKMTFDPTFILRKLEEFVLELAPSSGEIARIVASKNLPIPPDVTSRQQPGLNQSQSNAIAQMEAVPVLLLWGPPGTGKTRTIAAAAVKWMRAGKSVLILSTSNSAVDTAMKAVMKSSTHSERRHLLRLGVSLDSDVRWITAGGKLELRDISLADRTKVAQRSLLNIREELSSRTLSYERRHALFGAASMYERQISDFNERAMAAMPSVMADVRVIGCTVAKMVIDRDVRNQRFDVVIVDEASMTSMLYAFAAALLAGSQLVYAGDMKQLPPIVQSNGTSARKWFGKNVYDWFGIEVDGEVAATKVSLLDTQYRMTKPIGEIVSTLSYGGMLRHYRRGEGRRITLVDIDGEWQTKHYSVGEGSYYHVASIPIIHALSEQFEEEEVLLLSPFRPQMSLLTAIGFDIKRKMSEDTRIYASTIHRAQGSEAATVVVDLTTHSPQGIARFFREEHSPKLFNVAISRAKDRLFIIGSQAMLRELAASSSFWDQFMREVGGRIDVVSCESVIANLQTYRNLSELPVAASLQIPALYSHPLGAGAPHQGVQLLKKTRAARKLLVLPTSDNSTYNGSYIVRIDEGCPPVFCGGGLVSVFLKNRWATVESPNVNRVLWRIGFSHLADEELDPAQVKRFYCRDCPDGELVLKYFSGEGWFLVCRNGQSGRCGYQRRLSLEDAKLKVRFQGMMCDKGHPLTARSGKNGFFIGCENYPHCNFQDSLRVLSGF